MPFTEAQKIHFVALLQTKGWLMRDGTLWSPGGGLYFNDAHFEEWHPGQVRELFARRATRLEKHEIGNLGRAVNENRQVSWADGEVVNQRTG